MRHAGHQLPARTGGRTSGRRPHPPHAQAGGLSGRAGGVCQCGAGHDGGLGRALAGDLRHRLEHAQAQGRRWLQGDRRRGHRHAADQAQRGHHRRHAHQRMRGPGLEDRHQRLPRGRASEPAGGPHVLVLRRGCGPRGTSLHTHGRAVAACVAGPLGAGAAAGSHRGGEAADDHRRSRGVVVGQRTQARGHGAGDEPPGVQHPLPPEAAG